MQDKKPWMGSKPKWLNKEVKLSILSWSIIQLETLHNGQENYCMLYMPPIFMFEERENQTFRKSYILNTSLAKQIFPIETLLS